MGDSLLEHSGRIAAAAVVVILVLTAGCADATSPTLPVDRYELPAPDPSLEPDRLSIGEFIATPCAFGLYGDGLVDLLDREEWALVDVFFGRPSASGPWTEPTENDVALVESHGGRVLHRFNVPAVRARVLLSRLPGLVEDGFWITVRDVPDDTRYDVEIITGLTRSVGDADVERFRSLGGRITHRWQSISSLAGILPDRSIPDWREESVESVEPNSVACAG